MADIQALNAALEGRYAVEQPAPLIAHILFALGGFLSLLNFYLSFIRPRLRGPDGAREPRFVSGFPLVGSLLLVVAWFLYPSGHVLRPIALILALVDTGGIHWFAGTLAVRSLRGREPADG